MFSKDNEWRGDICKKVKFSVLGPLHPHRQVRALRSLTDTYVNPHNTVLGQSDPG